MVVTTSLKMDAGDPTHVTDDSADSTPLTPDSACRAIQPIRVPTRQHHIGPRPRQR